MPKKINADETSNKIKLILVKRNLTQDDLARGIKWGKSYVSGICSGEIKIGWLNICKLCQFLNVTPNEILPWEEWLEDANRRKKKKN